MLILLIHGWGGHGKVVADAAGDEFGSVFATDDASLAVHELIAGVATLEASRAHTRWVDDPNLRWHVSMGANAPRWAVIERYKSAFGLARSATVVHRSASVSGHAAIGQACFVAAGAVVAAHAQLGVGVIVNHLAVVDHDCVVGDGSHIAPRAVLGGAVRIGRRVLVGSGAVVLPGVRVADGCVIGAGAVLTQDAAQSGVYVGVPAKLIKETA